MGGIAGIEIRHDAVTMIDRMASSHPPTVQVLTPNGGEELAAGATISWTASDSDKDGLEFSIYYSPDDGQSWQLLAMDIPTTSWELVSLDGIAGSDQARVRVQANDGFFTGHDESDEPFSVPNSSPLPLILQPPDGLVLRANEPVVLEGMATDDEDGPINTGLTWQSSLDGDLGSGQELPVNLTPGKHRLTLTAIDSEGLTGADTVTILIVRASSEMFLPIVLSDY